MAFVRAAPKYLLCAICVCVLICIAYAARVNATTVALAMLLLVLATATRSGLAKAIFTSVACVFGFNYFFLPPVGTLTISDPQNWVALFAFLITAVTASELSARAKAREKEASVRRNEVERLYRLSRAMLMDQSTDIVRTALHPASDIFGLANVVFYDAELRQVFGSLEEPFLSEEALARVVTSGEAQVTERLAILPVRLGTRIIGVLGLEGQNLTEPERDSIANLIAIGYERVRALNRAAAAEAARQGEKLKTFLLDGIAHDLKTPLTAIKTCVTTLLMVPMSTEDKRTELLSIIDEETDHLQRTITEAIQLARVESGKISLDRQSFLLVESVIGVLSALPDRERYKVSIPSGIALKADFALLEQAIKQLLENASKYAPAGTGIEVAAGQEDGFLLFQVLDRGPGISPREMERIFEKFYRGTRGRSSTDGNGMGLAIAKGIIEAHGGTIRAENRPGGGAVFSFRLPLA